MVAAATEEAAGGSAPVAELQAPKSPAAAATPEAAAPEQADDSDVTRDIDDDDAGVFETVVHFGCRNRACMLPEMLQFKASRVCKDHSFIIES